jgi:hypothetical protein
MRKNLLLASLLFAGGLFTMNAQIWSDNFDAGVSNWTMVDSDGDGYNWEAVDLGAPNTPAMASYSYVNNVGPVTPNNYAISPAIDLTGVTGSITLSWDAKGQDASWAQERYTVYVATGNTVADFLASSVNYSEVVTDNGVGGVFYTKTLDISSFAGETIYVAFRHHDVTDMFSLHIDNVEVDTSASVDSALAGSFSVYPNPAKDMLNISNSIGAEINSVTVSDINGRTVKQVAANGVESQINIADLNAGVYFVNINSNQGSLTKKIVKQ